MRDRRGRGVVIAATLAALAGCGGQDPTRTPPAPLTPETTVGPALASDTVVVGGWPGMSRNPKGMYSWSPGTWENWMHNAMAGGSGDLSIIVEGRAGHMRAHEGTPVTVLGYEGHHAAGIPGEDFGTGGPHASCERWMVDIQGTTITIKLCAKPGSPPAEIREAHEIIESMRVEPSDSDAGFRLVFTLTTNTWDSG